MQIELSNRIDYKEQIINNLKITIMKKYVWVLNISLLSNEPRILIDVESFIFDSGKAARAEMIRLHEKISCKEACKMTNETHYPQKGFEFVCDGHFFGVQIVKKQVLTENDVNKLLTGYSIFL